MHLRHTLPTHDSFLTTGEKAKEIFVKSKLPFDKLGAIWNLADTKARGKLDLTDFIVGMHFIQSTMNGSLTTIPASLPAGLYEKAAGSLPSGLPSSPSFTSIGAQHTGSLGPQLTGGSTGFISRQMTGSTPVPSGIRSPPPPTSGTPLRPQRTGNMFSPAPTASASAASNWAVTPADKVKSDRFFDGLDQDRQGVLEGQAAVPFFMQSGLNETTLAHVWDLSDVTQSGSLTRDEFAVAMHLINLKITGSDLPSELPPSLVPPSLRGTNLPQAVNPKETDTQRDLFSLMDDDVDLPVSTASAFAVPAPNVAVSQGRSAPTTASGPFDDDFLAPSITGNAGAASPFPSMSGAPTTLSPVMTGASNAGKPNRFGGIEEPANRSAFQAPFADASSEAANQRLALESTQKSLTTLETTKAGLSKSVLSDANSISDLSTRLETVRMRHQTETEAVKALTERQAAQALELKKLREESVRDESELSRLKQEKDEIEQSVMKDREDVREMKRQVAERTKEKEALKLELEKLKKEARMQKGLVAIGKKQLNQSEIEVDAVRQEIDQVKSGKGVDEEVQQHAEHGEVAMGGASTREASTPAAVLSPAASNRSNNPFDRLPTGGSAAGGAAAGFASVVGIGAAVAHHDQSTTDSDPFGASTTPAAVSAAAPPPSSSAQGFDDSFGNHFDAPPVANNGGDGHNSAFDEAFSSFDEPNAKDTVAAEERAPALESDDISAAVPGSFAAAEAASPPNLADAAENEAEAVERGVSSPVAPSAPSLHGSTLEPLSSEADDVPPQSGLDKGKSQLRDEDDSSDEEEEPEDVESTAKRVIDSPDEMGAGKAAAYPDVGAEGADPEAASRYPALTDESILAKAPIPALSSDHSRATLGATEGTGVATSTVGDDSSASHVDAFHDTISADTPSRNELETGTGEVGGFAEVTGHDNFSTALDNGSASQRSLSPSASKTRRAPPPAPIRGGTISSATSPAVQSSPFASSAMPAPAPMDDFESAFSDLQPTGSQRTTVTNAPTATGFDDSFGFGQADDFDFIPSFPSASNGAINSAVPQSTAQTGGFDDFESSFNSSLSPSTAGVEVSKSQAAPALPLNRSGTGSGLKFDDVFGEPTPPAATTPAPATRAPPSLPSRGATATSNGALADDAAPVRQLCAMGFSRSDVIKALERSNYRTDKALERLLAQA